jgi:hypothetical protein
LEIVETGGLGDDFDIGQINSLMNEALKQDEKKFEEDRANGTAVNSRWAEMKWEWRS